MDLSLNSHPLPEVSRLNGEDIILNANNKQAHPFILYMKGEHLLVWTQN